jgi:hypothetical protein
MERSSSLVSGVRRKRQLGSTVYGVCVVVRCCSIFKHVWLTSSRYGGTLMANGELMAYNFLIVYLAIIQGSLAAGQWLSFGPSIIWSPNR